MASEVPTAGLELDIEKPMSEGDDGHRVRSVSLHSLDKAHYARFYADTVGRAMKNHGPLAWVELFAGPGRLFVRDTAQYEDGSPLQALGIPQPFNQYVFCDLDTKCVAALQARVGQRPGVTVLRGNANDGKLHNEIGAVVPTNALVVLYADPEGLDLHFQTIKFFADRYRRLDLLLNFPVPGIDRALAAGQERKAGKVLNHAAPVQLIGPGAAKSRTSYREFFERQLQTLGFEYFERQQVFLHQKHVALYDMLLATRKPLGKKFFSDAKKYGPNGQTSLGI